MGKVENYAFHSIDVFDGVHFIFYFVLGSMVESVQNATIEERVALLEIQMEQTQDDVTGLGVGLTEVDENVDFLFEEQVIQDERLLGLETRMLDVENVVEGDNFILKILPFQY